MGKNNKKVFNFTSKAGTEIKMALSAMLPERIPQKNEKNIDGFRVARLSSQEWGIVQLGIDALATFIDEGFTKLNMNNLKGNSDISFTRKNVSGFESIMNDIIRRINYEVNAEQYAVQRKEHLLNDPQIMDAARDGVLTKTEERKEVIDGKEKTVKYDTSITTGEIENLLNNYEREIQRIQYKKMHNYLGLGLGFAGTIGSVVTDVKSLKNRNKGLKGSSTLLTIGTVAACGFDLIERIVSYKSGKGGIGELRYKAYQKGVKMTQDIMENEAISNDSRDDEINRVFEVIGQERKLERIEDNRRFELNLIRDLVIAIIHGMYLSQNITKKENGKIDGKSFAKALIDIQGSTGIAKSIMSSIEGVIDNQNDEEDAKKLMEQIADIVKQMEEKVYPLQGARHSFNSFAIKDFHGKFYPKTNYETGERVYSKELNIPEFSIKRGETVLLSGESGSGKSTFLRLLKRGDINNRYPIEIDNGEKVDNLGNEYISFNPNMDLGEGLNVLYQITGKESISDLTKGEVEKMMDIYKKLGFDTSNLLEELASKKFIEFSTGQQIRLSLSKLFYRIDDATSVIIVDEPVGNVENNLIREQLKMIKEYAKNKNVMLILTTHRLELAEDLATKRYHIDKDGTMREIPIRLPEEQVKKDER